MVPDKKNASTRRAWLLNVFLIALFSLSMAVPVQPTLLPAAVHPSLPLSIGSWIGKVDRDTAAERDILAEDTKIEKSIYSNADGQLIYTSLVISGNDLNNSIHRPERCLLAQGHANITRDALAIDVQGLHLPVAHLASSKTFPTDDGPRTIGYHTYYWFIGHQTVTNSHYKRSFIDMFDRLTGGTAQQWAYISISTPEGSEHAGVNEETMRAFIANLAEKITRLDALKAPASQP